MRDTRTLVLNCLVFGRYFRNSFLDYMLDSLINAGIVEFSKKFEVVFIISTSPVDKIVIVNHPKYIYLEKFLTFEFHLLKNKSLHNTSKYRNVTLMKEAHKYAVSCAEERNSILGILVPDMMVNNEYFENINESVDSEKSVLLAPALRMTYLNEFLSLSQNGDITRYKSSNLVKSSILNLHSETKSFIFSTNEFLRYQGYITPTATLFEHKRIPNCFVGFGMSWFIVYIDFSKLTRRTKKLINKSLSQHTLDAYVIDSISQQKDVLIDLVRDSNRIFVVSWDKTEPSQCFSERALQIEMNSKQKCDLIELGMLSGLYDNFKIKNYSKPFFWNGSELATDENLSNYRIDLDFKTKFLSENVRKFNPGLLRYVIKLIRFSNAVVFSRKVPFNSQVKTSVPKKIYIKIFLLVKTFYYIATYKLTLHNPLNQPLGNRFLAVLRLATRDYFAWKLRKSKVDEKN